CVTGGYADFDYW
nr:immunoglobulin heavy chain junction region [Macaca mulatta]MOV50775.1 immunoglobulin heavy chain junction region [Macaca mulatta]MOV51874.1 immunoglobulin heavy chain junction region [Macaca mulatta]